MSLYTLCCTWEQVAKIIVGRKLLLAVVTRSSWCCLQGPEWNSSFSWYSRREGIRDETRQFFLYIRLQFQIGTGATTGRDSGGGQTSGRIAEMQSRPPTRIIVVLKCVKYAKWPEESRRMSLASQSSGLRFIGLCDCRTEYVCVPEHLFDKLSRKWNIRHLQRWSHTKGTWYGTVIEFSSFGVCAWCFVVAQWQTTYFCPVTTCSCIKTITILTKHFMRWWRRRNKNRKNGTMKIR